MKAKLCVALGIALLLLTGCGNHSVAQAPENVIAEQQQSEIHHDMLLSITRAESSTDVFGQTESYESTVEFTYEFDENGRVLSRKSNSEEFHELGLKSGLDAVELKILMEGLTAFEEQYFYDDLGRIYQIDLKDNTGKITNRFSYEYEGSSNRIKSETFDVNTHFSYEYSGENLIRIVNTDADSESASNYYPGSWLRFDHTDENHMDVFAGRDTDTDSYSTLRKQIECDSQKNIVKENWFSAYPEEDGKPYRIDTYCNGRIEQVEIIRSKTVVYTYEYGDYIIQ